jgi:hypothetical protein
VIYREQTQNLTILDIPQNYTKVFYIH